MKLVLNMLQDKIIGILGGMGPQATSEFYSKLIKICQKNGAVQDTDYPQIVMNSLPLEGFDETGIVDEILVLNQLKKGIDTLVKAGSDFIVIPCNTVHYFIEDMRKHSPIPILSILEETAKQVNSTEHIGLLASETTLKMKLYQKVLDDKNIKFVVPTKFESEKITNAILLVMAGKTNGKTVLNLIEKMKNGGADKIIIGCTELPLLLENKKIPGVLNTIDILADATINYSKNLK